MIKELKQKIEKTINDLKTVDNIRLTVELNNLPASAEEIAMVEKILEYPLSPTKKEFYSTINGFKIMWSIQNDSIPGLEGQINICDLKTAIGGKHHLLSKAKHKMAHENVIWGDNTSSREKTYLKQHKLIESVFGLNLCVTFDYTDLYYDSISVIYNNNLYSPQLNFEMYLNYALDTYGLATAKINMLKNDYHFINTNDPIIQNFEKVTGLKIKPFDKPLIK